MSFGSLFKLQITANVTLRSLTELQITARFVTLRSLSGLQITASQSGKGLTKLMGNNPRLLGWPSTSPSWKIYIINVFVYHVALRIGIVGPD